MDVKECTPSISIRLDMAKDGESKIYIIAPIRMEDDACFDIQEAFDLMVRKLGEGFTLVNAETYVYLFPKVTKPAERLTLNTPYFSV